MRRIQEIEVTNVANRNLIPSDAVGLFYVEDEDVVVLKT